MIGDTISTVDRSAATGNLPDHAAGITVLRKANQDAFGAEYRLRGTLHDYILKVRNTPAGKSGESSKYTRHNAELTVILRAVLTGTPAPEVRYVVSMTVRLPVGGDIALMRAIVGHLAGVAGIQVHSSKYMMDYFANFES